MIWQHRMCKVEDGLFMLSAVDDYDNWDFAPDVVSPKMAVAGHLFAPPFAPFIGPAVVKGLAFIDDEHLLIVGSDGSLWCLIGNPAATGRIVKLEVEK